MVIDTKQVDLIMISVQNPFIWGGAACGSGILISCFQLFIWQFHKFLHLMRQSSKKLIMHAIQYKQLAKMFWLLYFYIAFKTTAIFVLLYKVFPQLNLKSCKINESELVQIFWVYTLQTFFAAIHRVLFHCGVFYVTHTHYEFIDSSATSLGKPVHLLSKTNI